MSEWQPGQSGNPSGRPPKGQAFSELLERELARESRGGTQRDQLARVLVRLALKGNLVAIEKVLERTEGKVPDRLRGELEVRGQVTVYLPERRPSE